VIRENVIGNGRSFSIARDAALTWDGRVKMMERKSLQTKRVAAVTTRRTKKRRIRRERATYKREVQINFKMEVRDF
jgi:hypothetical protein